MLTNEDLNNIRTAGTYYSDGVDRLTNKPISTLYNNIIVVHQQANSRCIQLFTCINSCYRYWRRYNGTNWSEWYLIYDHNLLTNTTELSSLASALKPYLDAL